MAKKKLVKKKKVKNPWFRRRAGSVKKGWGFIPINLEGWVSLLLLIGVNVFAANYFKLNNLLLDSWLSFGVVFFLSIFVFIMIARRKTKV